MCAENLKAAKKNAERLVERLPLCLIPEAARLRRTLQRWKAAFLAYFTSGRSLKGGAEVINGIIELRRRLVRGCRNRENYRPRMPLAAEGLDC
ncbi:transposase [Brevibacterium salitolerans]|uniref:Transposase IS204/IS1001/IS1096/IS1165 DDE domain-containing protein n=1 Tax=Brevibacterium salitolerans TaxID=1403566 RepID=A0ABP5I4M0_9MICO